MLYNEPYEPYEFNRLFRVSSQQESKISEIGRWEENEWIWEFVWRRGLRER